MKTLFRYIIFLTNFIFLFNLIQCGTLGNQKKLIYVKTNMEDAMIVADGNPIGMETGVLEITDYKREKIPIEAQINGRQTEKAELERDINPVTYLNLCFLALSPVLYLVDYLTDNLFTYNPKILSLELKNDKVSEKSKSLPNKDAKPLNKSTTKVYQYFFSSLTLINDETGEEIRIPESPSTTRKPFYSGVEVEPGNYTLLGNLEIEEREKDNKTTYYSAKSIVKKKIRIIGGGDTVICGDYIKASELTTVTKYNIPDQIAKKYNYDPENNVLERKVFPYFFNACSYPNQLIHPENRRIIENRGGRKTRVGFTLLPGSELSQLDLHRR